MELWTWLVKKCCILLPHKILMKLFYFFLTQSIEDTRRKRIISWTNNPAKHIYNAKLCKKFLQHCNSLPTLIIVNIRSRHRKLRRDAEVSAFYEPEDDTQQAQNRSQLTPWLGKSWVSYKLWHRAQSYDDKLTSHGSPSPFFRPGSMDGISEDLFMWFPHCHQVIRWQPMWLD